MKFSPPYLCHRLGTPRFLDCTSHHLSPAKQLSVDFLLWLWLGV